MGTWFRDDDTVPDGGHGDALTGRAGILTKIAMRNIMVTAGSPFRMSGLKNEWLFT
jgi:hypothetical protein